MKDAERRGVYLFCLVSRECRPGPELANVPAASVEALDRPTGTFWAERVESAPEPSVETVRRHHGIVEAAWRTCPACVPLRFGHWFASDEALDRALAGVGPELGEALARVEGCGEFSVRVMDPRKEAPAGAGSRGSRGRASTGRQYLEDIRRRQGGVGLEVAGVRVAREVGEALGGLARDQRVEPLPSRHGVVSMTHLVARSDEEAYLEAVEGARAARPELRFLVSGPWPPYGFGP